MLLRMDKEQVIAKLRAHEAELKNAGVVHLRLFGSVVRGEQGPESDIDLAAEFDRGKCKGIIDQVHVKNKLAEVLGAEVHLSDALKLEQEVNGNFIREAELVF